MGVEIALVLMISVLPATTIKADVVCGTVKELVDAKPRKSIK